MNDGRADSRENSNQAQPLSLIQSRPDPEFYDRNTQLREGLAQDATRYQRANNWFDTITVDVPQHFEKRAFGTAYVEGGQQVEHP